jgi:hypothetical protein
MWSADSGEYVYLVVRGRVGREAGGEVRIIYGEDREVIVDTREPGVFVIGAAAAQALAVTLPVSSVTRPVTSPA